MDTSLKRTAGAGPEGVCHRESSPYYCLQWNLYFGTNVCPIKINAHIIYVIYIKGTPKTSPCPEDVLLMRAYSKVEILEERLILERDLLERA